MRKVSTDGDERKDLDCPQRSKTGASLIEMLRAIEATGPWPVVALIAILCVVFMGIAIVKLAGG